MTKENLRKKREKIMHEQKGFIAALDQSGGSTPKALSLYGINENEYSSEKEMYDLIHKMRSRVIKSSSFTNKHIIGAILFEKTMENKIDDLYTADYLWEKKQILPFLKIDDGLDNILNDVQLMKPIENLSKRLAKAVKYNIFGTKMRSVIHGANKEGIKEIVKQQFDLAKIILSFGLIPIIEPEVNITIADKIQAEDILREELFAAINTLGDTDKIILKLSLPTTANHYEELVSNHHVLRIVALSGGYKMNEANDLLAHNKNIIASFSRALLEGLYDYQSDYEFEAVLKTNIEAIYSASIHKK